MFELHRETRSRIAGLVAAIVVILGTTAAAQVPILKSADRVNGINNFGRVTARYFRGGEVTAEGIENLYAMGVRTIVNLQDEPEPAEAEACQRLGIAYHTFPLTNHEVPAEGVMDKVIELISSSNAGIYVHCTGGKHRSGTACALYRMKVQGWSPEQAWAEEEEYGFGPPEEHSELFNYLYANTTVAKRLGNTNEIESAKIELPSTASARAAVAAPLSSAISSSARYIAPEEAIRLAKAAGATGDLTRLVLEYDDGKATVLWKVLFSAGVEYRFDALTGAAAGTKKKESTVLSPLDLASAHVGFERVLKNAEKATGGKVIELELKRVKGRDTTYFEIAMAGGATIYVDASNGKRIVEF